MADSTPRPGRLIALDGSRGRDVIGDAELLAARLRQRGHDCGISRWDASGVFGDLLLADCDDLAIAPRALTLLYAADLMFRLKWEIRPALAEGKVVIAAPYVNTAIAVGVGIGLGEAWLRDVLRFAEAPEIGVLARERKPQKGWRAHAARGYAEFCVALLDGAPPGLARRKGRRRGVAWLRAAAESAGAPPGRKTLESL
jgi:dTMP kinase